jgi:hypothetical protein
MENRSRNVKNPLEDFAEDFAGDSDFAWLSLLGAPSRFKLPNRTSSPSQFSREWGAPAPPRAAVGALADCSLKDMESHRTVAPVPAEVTGGGARHYTRGRVCSPVIKTKQCDTLNRLLNSSSLNPQPLTINQNRPALGVGYGAPCRLTNSERPG